MARVTSVSAVVEPIRARWRAIGRVDRIAIAVIAGQMIVRAWLILPGAFIQDDYHVLRATREEPLSWDLLTRSGNGHLSPGNYLLTWVLSQFAGPHAWLPAAIILLLLQLAVSVFIWAGVRRLVGPTPGAVIGLAVASFTPVMFSTVTWWSAGSVTLGIQLAMAVGAYCHLRYLDERSWTWLAGASGALAIGLVLGEKALFVPVVLVLVTVLARPGRPMAVVRTLLRQWPVWLAQAAVGAAYLAAYLYFASVGEGYARTVESALRLARHQILDLFLRGLLGGPWHSVMGGAQWLPLTMAGILMLLQVVIAVLWVSHRIAGARALLAAAVLGFYLLLNVGLTIRGRGQFVDYIQLDPRYVADAVPIAAFCVAVMLTPSRPLTVPAWLRGRSAVLAGAAVLVLFNSSLVSASAMSAALQRTDVNAWLDNARAAVEADPNMVLFDGYVPDSIMISLFPDAEKRVSSILAAYGLHPRFDRPTDAMRILDGTGVAKPVALVFTQQGEVPFTSSCGTRLDARTGLTEFQLSEEVPEGRRVLELKVDANAQAVLEVGVTGEQQLVGIRPGRHTLLMVVEGGDDVARIRWVRGLGAVCVSSLTVGYPAPASE